MSPASRQQSRPRSIDLAPSNPYFVCMANVTKKKSRRKAVMLGLGLDSDGHKRLTTGPNFVLMGGSAETHEVMTEKVTKINEKLAATGKRLEEISRRQFDDIAHSVGLKQTSPNQA